MRNVGVTKMVTKQKGYKGSIPNKAPKRVRHLHPAVEKQTWFEKFLLILLKFFDIIYM